MTKEVGRENPNQFPKNIVLTGEPQQVLYDLPRGIRTPITLGHLKSDVLGSMRFNPRRLTFSVSDKFGDRAITIDEVYSWRYNDPSYRGFHPGQKEIVVAKAQSGEVVVFVDYIPVERDPYDFRSPVVYVQGVFEDIHHAKEWVLNSEFSFSAPQRYRRTGRL